MANIIKDQDPNQQVQNFLDHLDVSESVQEERDYLRTLLEHLDSNDLDVEKFLMITHYLENLAKSMKTKFADLVQAQNLLQQNDIKVTKDAEQLFGLFAVLFGKYPEFMTEKNRQLVKKFTKEIGLEDKSTRKPRP